MPAKIYSAGPPPSGLHSINAFAVALCDNIRRIRDVAERGQKRSMRLNAGEESISGAEKVSYIIRGTACLASMRVSHYLKHDVINTLRSMIIPAKLIYTVYIDVYAFGGTLSSSKIS